MKKFLLIILTLFILVPLVGTFDIHAQDLASCNYEVAYINDDGSFSQEACYDDFNSAKAKMKELGGDRVVRHNASVSPTKIIAMNSGIAYSYPRASATLNIYQDVNNVGSIYYKSTYVARHFELNYIDTERYFIGSTSGKGAGMIEVNVNGFHGFCDLENTDLVPSKFIRNGIVIELGGNNTYDGEGTFKVIAKQNYYEAVKTNNYYELVYHIYRGYPTKNSTSPVSETIVIGPASTSMKENTKYYSYNGYKFYDNDSFSGTCITYYNYYMFLPLRSKTSVSANTLNTYISNVSGSVMKNTGQNFIDAQNKYGINALILFAMACHESGNGTSSYAIDRNNLFGWNAVDADPSKASYFNSVTDCINEQAGINLRGYVDITDGRFFSSSLGNKGSGLNVKYASDPYWGMEIASICYAIDKLDNNKDGTLTDFNKYSLSLINSFNINVKASASDNSKTLYTTEYGPYYQENFIVINLSKGDFYTKVQSTNPIDSSGNIKTHRTPITTGELNPISYGEYDFDLSVAYIKNEYLTSINSTKVIDNDDVDKDLELMFLIDDLKIENNQLLINGCAFIKGLDAIDASKISHTLSVKNIMDDSLYKTYSANTSKYDGIYFNDGHTYDYVGFDVSIPLSDLVSGNYYFTIDVKNNDEIYSASLSSFNNNFSNLNTYINSLNYHLKINSYYNYRLELDVDSLPSVIDYTLVNKPSGSTRNSLFSFDSFKFDENLNLYIDGQAMIYYVDFNDQNKIKYTLYLVDDSDNYYEYNLETLSSDLDYQKLLNSSYNMDYICFKTNEIDLSNLNDGMYMLIMKIENGDYIDYVEVSNLARVDLPSTSRYRFFTSNIRDRVMLEVGDVS